MHVSNMSVIGLAAMLGVAIWGASPVGPMAPVKAAAQATPEPPATLACVGSRWGWDRATWSVSAAALAWRCLSPPTCIEVLGACTCRGNSPGTVYSGFARSDTADRLAVSA